MITISADTSTYKEAAHATISANCLVREIVPNEDLLSTIALAIFLHCFSSPYVLRI